MTNLPSVTDPLERALINALLETAVSWTPVDVDATGELAAKARTLLVKAGLLAAHHRWELTIARKRWFRRAVCDSFWLQFYVCGNYQTEQHLSLVYQNMPADWLDRAGRTVGKVDIDWLAFHELRLTDQGEIAAADVSKGETTFFFEYVLRRGMTQHISPLPAGVVRVDGKGTGSFRESAATASDGQALAVAAAHAEASVVIQNNIDLSGAVAQLLTAMQQQSRKDTPGPVETVPESQEPAGSPKAQEPQQTDTGQPDGAVQTGPQVPTGQGNENCGGTGQQDGNGTPDDVLPKRRRKLSPSRIKAKAAHDWAMSAIPNAEAMTIAELFDAIVHHPSDASEGLPDNAEAFGRYLRDAGVSRYNRRRDKQDLPSADEI